MKKIIVLNGGSATRKAFQSGAGDLPVEYYHSKNICLHIKSTGEIIFIHDNQPIDFQDSYVFTRLRATDAQFCGILYEHLEALGIPTSDKINLSYKNSEEKISQMTRFARTGIKIPETIIAREESYLKNKDYINKHITFPLVYKNDGSRGNNVFKVEDKEDLEKIITAKKPHELFLLQEYIENTFDTRTLVAYGEILGSIKRSAAPGEFLNNVAKGATVDSYELTDEEKLIAIKATAVTKLDFGGVDIIHTTNGPLVIEVNKAPQIKGFESIHGSEFVFKRIAELISAQF